MQAKLRAYMDHLFSQTRPTKAAVELKEEMLQNLTDKYNDLIAEGKTPEAAYNIATASIGDISELLAQLKQEESQIPHYTEEQIQQIRKSIEEFGMNDPIAIWKDNEIIEGHGRLLACRQMGMKEVPVIRLDDLTDEQRRAYMNVHNHLTMNTGFDFEILNEELARIENIDMGQFGFDIEDFLGETDPEVEEDDYKEPDKLPARSKEGQRFRLGEHILMCGDSTKPEDVEKLTGGVPP